MLSVEAYEANLPQRLDELRRGDPAYQLHVNAIWQAVIHARELHGTQGPQHILDCGCGLGFLTSELMFLGDSVVGIDPSEKAVSLAKAEHPAARFYISSAESFPSIMAENNVPPFDTAVLNMVLHSVGDNSAAQIIKGVYQCLKPEGTIILIVPAQYWLMQKLIEYAQDRGMEREAGIAWVGKQLRLKTVDLPVKIRGGDYYPQPLRIFNRTPSDYGDLLLEGGFSVKWEEYDSKTKKLLSRKTYPYMDMNDYSASQCLYARDRLILMSFAFPKE